MAVAALVLGLLSLAGIGSILAIVLGTKAKREIDHSGGTQTGRGMAVAGIVLGWAWIGIVLVLLVAATALTRSVEYREFSISGGKVSNSAHVKAPVPEPAVGQTTAGAPLPYLPTLRNPAPKTSARHRLQRSGFSFLFLTESRGCIVAMMSGLSSVRVKDEFSWLVIFRPGYHLVRETDGKLWVADPSGRSVAKVGGRGLSSGLHGALVPANSRSQVAALASTAEPVPTTCRYDRVIGTDAFIPEQPGR